MIHLYLFQPKYYFKLHQQNQIFRVILDKKKLPFNMTIAGYSVFYYVWMHVI